MENRRENGAVWEKEERINPPDYGILVMEMVPQIENDGFWHFVYDMIIAFKRKWGI